MPYCEEEQELVMGFNGVFFWSKMAGSRIPVGYMHLPDCRIPHSGMTNLVIANHDPSSIIFHHHRRIHLTQPA